jgi:hypothetical protein
MRSQIDCTANRDSNPKGVQDVFILKKQGQNFGCGITPTDLELMEGVLPHAEVLPCLEKHGKSCHMLLSRAEVYFIQTTEDADGMQVAARCANVCLPYPYTPPLPRQSAPGPNFYYNSLPHSILPGKICLYSLPRASKYQLY